MYDNKCGQGVAYEAQIAGKKIIYSTIKNLINVKKLIKKLMFNDNIIVRWVIFKGRRLNATNKLKSLEIPVYSENCPSTYAFKKKK